MQSVEKLQSLDLRLHEDLAKNWDSLAALETITQKFLNQECGYEMLVGIVFSNLASTGLSWLLPFSLSKDIIYHGQN